MENLIKILHLEDSERDSELVQAIIESDGIKSEYFCVDDESGFKHILSTVDIDIILSDFKLPDYNGDEALKLAREQYPHIPFIFVSGTIDEDTAIIAMVNGATDYVLKRKMDRLMPAIKRALYERELEKSRIESLNDIKEKSKQLRIQNDKYILVNKELAYQNAEKEKRAAELVIANKELAYQNVEKENRATELIAANKELIYQNDEKEKRAAELIIANEELIFQNDEKEKRAAELVIANDELAYQNDEKEKRATELIIANKELHYQNAEKEKRAAELVIANKELAYQNDEKEKRAAELVIANDELAYQNYEKEKRAAELIIANKELHFQNDEKEKRAAELIIANKELHFQNDEKEKRAAELVIAKENAEESDNLKTAFLQNMTHEIRTPLNEIIGFSGLLNKEDLSKEDITDFTSMISESGHRLIEIVGNIIDISKIQTGQIKIEQQIVQVDSLLAELFNNFQSKSKAKNITLSYSHTENVSIQIKSDELRLRQIISNLLNNAIKFTNSGSVDFGCIQLEDSLRFYVKDTGIGIPKELHDKIFNIFIQAELSISRSYEGAGLGLSISKGLVELMGGTIRVDSELNAGTTFYFTIPILTKQ